MQAMKELWPDDVSAPRFFGTAVGLEVIANAMIYPFYLCKTHLQVTSHSESMLKGKTNPFMELWREGKNTVKNFGVRGLYRGYTWSTVSCTPGIVAHIALYASMKYHLGYEEHQTFENSGNFRKQQQQQAIAAQNKNSHKYLKYIPNIMIPFVSGLIAESVAVMLYVPSDVVTQHLMLSSQYNTHKKTMEYNTSVFTLISKIYNKDGIYGFWRGTQAAYLTYLPSAGVWWMSYEIYKKLICQEISVKFGNDDSKIHKINMNNMFGYTLAGIAGGATTAACTNPIDVIRARIQTQTMDYGQSSVKGLIREMYKHEGLYGFTRGVGGRILLMVAEGVLFGDFYELLMYLSRIDPLAANSNDSHDSHDSQLESSQEDTET